MPRIPPVFVLAIVLAAHFDPNAVLAVMWLLLALRSGPYRVMPRWSSADS